MQLPYVFITEPYASTCTFISSVTCADLAALSNSVHTIRLSNGNLNGDLKKIKINHSLPYTAAGKL